MSSPHARSASNGTLSPRARKSRLYEALSYSHEVLYEALSYSPEVLLSQSLAGKFVLEHLTALRLDVTPVRQEWS